MRVADLVEDLKYIARRGKAVFQGARDFSAFVARGEGPVEATHVDERPVVVVVQHWWGTAEPWCQLALARLLHRKNGNTVVLHDDTNINPRDIGTAIEHLFIARVLETFPGVKYRLSNFRGDNPLSDGEIAAFARIDAIKGYRGEEWSARQAAHAERVQPALATAAGRIEAFIAAIRPRYFVVSTGFQASGALYVPVAKRHGIRVATTDGNVGSRLLAVAGVAAQLPDVARSYAIIGDLPKWARDIVQAHWDRRASAKDPLQYQPVASGTASSPERIGPLLPLNQSWDTSAMGMGRFFEGHDDWLMKTTAWLLENTDETVTIRQHPVERISIGNDDYGARLRRHFGEHPRIRFYDASAKVNTYDLVRAAKVVLPYTSSVGMEAIANGVPVVTETNSFYAQMGVVTPAEDRDDYFAQVRAALDGKLVVTQEARDRATACYYLSQIVSYVPTVFTGYADDFARWSAESLDWLWQRPDVQMVLTALDDEVPLPVLRHRALEVESKGTAA